MKLRGKAWLHSVHTGKSIFWLLLVVLGALVLRIYRIDWQSSLSDENFSLMLADRSFGKMMAGIIRDAHCITLLCGVG